MYDSISLMCGMQHSSRTSLCSDQGKVFNANHKAMNRWLHRSVRVPSTLLLRGEDAASDWHEWSEIIRLHSLDLDNASERIMLPLLLLDFLIKG
jgi:hypothetical protein